MATELSEDFRAMLAAYGRLHPANRDSMVWYINEARLRRIVRQAWGEGFSDSEPLPDGMRFLGILIEVVESPEILLVMKVT